MSETRFRQLGEFWLSQRPGRPHYYITWFDGNSGQTRRKTTSTGDLEEAERRLAEHFQLCERLDRERPSDVPLMTILGRYTKLGWDAIFKRIVKGAGLADVSPYVIRQHRCDRNGPARRPATRDRDVDGPQFGVKEHYRSLYSRPTGILEVSGEGTCLQMLWYVRLDVSTCNVASYEHGRQGS